MGVLNCYRDAHRGIQREAAAVLPPEHLIARVCLQQPPTHEGLEHSAAHLLLHLQDGRLAQLRDGVKAHALALSLVEPLDDARMKMVMRVERGPEAVGEQNRPGARLRPGARTLAAQRPLHFLEKDAQHPTCQRRVAVQKPAQAFGQR